jgi:hypothetical protein
MMFSSFEISKEAMSFEEVGDDSYDYFKKFYSQVFNEKANDADTYNKPVNDELKSDQTKKVAEEVVKATKSKFQKRNISNNSVQRFSCNYKSTNDIKSFDKAENKSYSKKKNSLENPRFDSQVNYSNKDKADKELNNCKELTTIKVRANSKINKNKGSKQNDMNNKVSQTKKLFNVSKGATEKMSIYKNAKTVKSINTLK